MAFRISRRQALIGGLGSSFGFGLTQAQASSFQVATSKLTAADGREVSVKLFAIGRRGQKSGLIVFSHGSNSSGELYDTLLIQLAQQSGFVVAAPTHVDCETNPDRAKFDQSAIFQTRLADIKLVAENGARLALEAGVLSSEFDPAALVVAGHSYGAWQALMCVGAGCGAFGIGAGGLSNPLFKAALAVSPPGAVPGMIDANDYRSIAAPIMITTGRRDILPGFVERWEDRLLAFDSCASKAAALIMPDVDHYFGGAIGRLNQNGPPAHNSLRITSTLLADFTRAYGQNDRSSLRRLVRADRSSLDFRLKL
jgi:hypothetical protein